MAVTKFSSGSSFKNLTKYDDFLAGNTAYDPAATWLIQRVAGTGSSGTITFSSIPSGYTSLQIRFIAKTSDTSVTDMSSLTIRFNGDTGSNYAYHSLRGNGSAVAASGSSSQTLISSFYSFIPTSLSLSNMFATGIIDIHDYTSTSRNKTVRISAGTDLNRTTAPTGIAVLSSGLWLATPAAITSITIGTDLYNFTTDTQFALYGMKG